MKRNEKYGNLKCFLSSVAAIYISETKLQPSTHAQLLVLNCITVIQTDLMNDEQTVNKCLLKICFLFSLNKIWRKKRAIHK